MQEVIEYLQKKYQEYNPNNPKGTRTAYKLINEYEIEIDKAVRNAVEILSYHLRKEGSTNTGMCKLTAASSAIGNRLIQLYGKRDSRLYDESLQRRRES